MKCSVAMQIDLHFHILWASMTKFSYFQTDLKIWILVLFGSFYRVLSTDSKLFFKRRLTLRNEVRKCMNKSTVITKICWTVLDFFTRYVQNTGCIEKTWTSLLSNLLVRMFRFSLRTVYRSIFTWEKYV